MIRIHDDRQQLDQRIEHLSLLLLLVEKVPREALRVRDDDPRIETSVAPIGPTRGGVLGYFRSSVSRMLEALPALESSEACLRSEIREAAGCDLGGDRVRTLLACPAVCDACLETAANKLAGLVEQSRRRLSALLMADGDYWTGTYPPALNLSRPESVSEVDTPDVVSEEELASKFLDAGGVLKQIYRVLLEGLHREEPRTQNAIVHAIIEEGHAVDSERSTILNRLKRSSKELATLRWVRKFDDGLVLTEVGYSRLIAARRTSAGRRGQGGE